MREGASAQPVLCVRAVRIELVDRDQRPVGSARRGLVDRLGTAGEAVDDAIRRPRPRGPPPGSARSPAPSTPGGDHVLDDQAARARARARAPRSSAGGRAPCGPCARRRRPGRRPPSDPIAAQASGSAPIVIPPTAVAPALGGLGGDQLARRAIGRAAAAGPAWRRRSTGPSARSTSVTSPITSACSRSSASSDSRALSRSDATFAASYGVPGLGIGSLESHGCSME